MIRSGIKGDAGIEEWVNKRSRKAKAEIRSPLSGGGGKNRRESEPCHGLTNYPPPLREREERTELEGRNYARKIKRSSEV